MATLDPRESGTAAQERLVERNGRALDSKIGFEIGWDIASYGLRPPVLPNDALLSGYEEASSRRASKPLTHDRFVRKWLQLRVGAWLRHRVVDEAVTPAYLRNIDATHCPVTGCALTYGTGADTDWSVDRINNCGGYAPGNLAVISAQANRAKGRKTFAEVVALAANTPEGSPLTSLQWARMAALMLVPCHITETECPVIPYPLKPPRGVPMSFDQTLQWVLVNQCYGGPKTVIGRLKAACIGPKRQREFHQLVQKVRRKSEKLADWTSVWLTPSLWSAFEDFIRGMDAGEQNRMRGLLSFKDSTWDRDQLESWHLDCRGYTPGYNPPDERAVALGLDRGCEAAAADEVAQALEALLEEA